MKLCQSCGNRNDLIPSRHQSQTFTDCETRNRSWLILWIILFLLFTLSELGISQSLDNTHYILYLNSYHPGYGWSDDIEKGFWEGIQHSDLEVELFVEYLDSRRFLDEAWHEKKATILLEKYEKISFDLIVATDNYAVDFAIKYRDTLSPKLPIVFCGYNNLQLNQFDDIPYITGINEEIDIDGLIQSAIKIQPRLDTLVFILSTSDLSSKINTERAESIVSQKYAQKYDIIFLKDKAFEKIIETVTHLPKESAVFLLGQTDERGQGITFSYVRYGNIIAKASSAPVYSLWDFHIGNGVLGGKILRGYDQGRVMTDMALSILHEKSVDNIPILMISPSKYIYDYNVMKLYNIPINRLPEGSIVLNKPHSMYEENKDIVWTTVFIFTILVILIAILLLNIKRRKKIEEELQNHRNNLEELVNQRTSELTEMNKALTDSEERFRGLSDAAFEGIVFSENGIVLETNNRCCEISGYSKEEIIGMPIMSLVHPDEREKVMNRIKTGSEIPYESISLRKDGTSFPAMVHGKMLNYKGRLIRVSAVRDITALKKAQEEIKTLQGILPICSFCKKIRDDKGYWNQVEYYIREHSGAEFSHSICHDCMKEHYPEQYKQMATEDKHKRA